MMSGTPPIDPQVTIDPETGSTSIYFTVEATLSISLNFFGYILSQGKGVLDDWHIT